MTARLTAEHREKIREICVGPHSAGPCCELAILRTAGPHPAPCTGKGKPVRRFYVEDVAALLSDLDAADAEIAAKDAEIGRLREAAWGAEVESERLVAKMNRNIGRLRELLGEARESVLFLNPDLLARIDAALSGQPDGQPPEVADSEPALSGEGERVVWCVRHRHGWCATADGRQHHPCAANVSTLCGHQIVLPWGSERRRPTCSECLTIAEEAAGRGR